MMTPSRLRAIQARVDAAQKDGKRVMIVKTAPIRGCLRGNCPHTETCFKAGQCQPFAKKKRG